MDRNISQELDEIWSGDLLGRRHDAESLINFLINRTKELKAEGRASSYVLNIDAGWGFGKTFFLERMQKQLSCFGHPAVYINAWRDDFAADPLIAVMAAIDTALQPWLSGRPKLKRYWQAARKSGLEIASTLALGVLRKAAVRYVGEAVDDASELLSGTHSPEAKPMGVPKIEAHADDEDPTGTVEGVEKLFDRFTESALSHFKQTQDSIGRFRGNLEVFLSHMAKQNNVKPPMFILIDELDRCRPTYSISLLERVKHLFELNNVVFVIATDSDQLRHAINAVYGSGFDSSRYLLRFFNRSYVFEEPKIKDFVSYQFSIHAIDEEKLNWVPNIPLLEFVAHGFEYFSLSLRDAEQCLDLLRSIITVWDHKRLKIQLVPMLICIIAFQQGIRDRRLWGNGAIAKFVAERKVGGGIWSFPYEVGRYPDRRLEQIEVRSIFTNLMLVIDSTLNNLAHNAGDSPSDAWIGHVFSEEFAFLHNNSFDPRQPPKTIILDYPRLVHTAGRFRMMSTRTLKT